MPEIRKYSNNNIPWLIARCWENKCYKNEGKSPIFLTPPFHETIGRWPCNTEMEARQGGCDFASLCGSHREHLSRGSTLHSTKWRVREHVALNLTLTQSTASLEESKSGRYSPAASSTKEYGSLIVRIGIVDVWYLADLDWRCAEQLDSQQKDKRQWKTNKDAKR